MIKQERLINHLALQVCQCSDFGLYHGRLGIILAFYSHGKVMGNKRLCEYTKDVLQASMIDDVVSEIGLENGLAGIGLGITMLLKAGMFHDDLNDLLYEIDNKLMDYDPRRMTDISFRTGMEGILYYIDMRLGTNQECNSIDSMYIAELKANMAIRKKYYENCRTLIDSLVCPNWEKGDFLGNEIGIDNGCAYFLISDTYDKIFSL